MKRSRQVNSTRDSQWLKSYFLVVLAISIVLISYAGIIVSQVRKDADTNNRLAMDYYFNAMEKNLKSLQDYSSTLLYSEKTKKLHACSDTEIFNADNLSVAYDLIYDVRNYILANGMLEDIYIYFPKTDCIIGKKGCYSSYAYFKTENIGIFPLMEEYYLWMKMLFTNDTDGFQPCSDGNGHNYVFYSGKATASDGSYRKVVAKISRQQLSNYISEMVIDSAFVGLVDANGSIYAGSGNVKDVQDEDGHFVSPEKTKQYIEYRANSEMWPLMLVAVMDFHSAYQIAKFTTNILTCGFAVAVAVGLIMGSFFAANNKRKMERIKNRFASSKDHTTTGDYEYICAEIDKLQQENRYAIAAAEQQQKMIDAIFLKELLQKRNDTETAVDRLCGLYNISFENDLFSIVTGQNSAASAQQIQYMIEQNRHPDFIIFWTQLESTEVFLCNFDMRTKNVQTPVLEFARKLRDAGLDDVNISPVIAAPSDISSSWREMSCCWNSGDAPPEWSRKSKANQRLIGAFQTAIEQDRLSDAAALLPELCRNIEDGKNANLALCRRHALLCQLYETFDNEQMTKQLDILAQTRDKKEWEQKLAELLQSQDRELNRKLDTRQIADLAQELIHREYQNPQLGLQMLAEGIGVSQSYLSRLFKSKFGMSVIQYLNYYRVEQAKILMLKGSENLKVIAVRVGFTSDVNLIRVFKSFEKTTPGQFRNRNDK